jgi:hypothetical protein
MGHQLHSRINIEFEAVFIFYKKMLFLHQMCQKCAVLCTDLKLFLTHHNTNNDTQKSPMFPGLFDVLRETCCNVKNG